MSSKPNKTRKKLGAGKTASAKAGASSKGSKKGTKPATKPSTKPSSKTSSKTTTKQSINTNSATAKTRPQNANSATAIQPSNTMLPSLNGMTRARAPSMDDALTKLTLLLEEQKLIIEKLKRENSNLIHENGSLKKKARSVGPAPKRALPPGGPPGRALPGMPKPGAKSQSVDVTAANLNPPTLSRKADSADVVDLKGMSSGDAKKSLANLFGAKKPPHSHAASDSLLRTGHAATAMILPGLAGLDESKTAPADDDDANRLEIKTPGPLVKYVKLKKMMPIHVVMNRMKMEGIPKILVCQFEGKFMEAGPPDGVKIKNTPDPKAPPVPLRLQHFVKKKNTKGAKDYSLQGPFGLPAKRKLTPSKKMKRLHWTVLQPDTVITSVWKSVDDTLVKFNSIEFELNFQFRQPKPKEGAKNANKKPVNKDEKVEWLAPKRSQNVQIALSKFRKSNEQIRDSVIEMDEKMFDMDTLEKFLDTAPSEDEQREAERYGNKHPNATYGKAEQFFYALIDLPDLQLRLQLWLFKLQFKELLSDRQAQLHQLETACMKTRKSECLKDILQIILAFGNYMNADTYAGMAYGYSLESLRLLPSVKTFDNSMSMMMYLYKFLYEKHHPLLKIFEELTILKSASKMETDMLDKSMRMIKEQIVLVEKTIETFEDEYEDVLPINDRFVPVMKKFLKTQKPVIKKLVARYEHSQTICKNLAAYFAYDLSKARVETLFALVQEFLTNLSRAKDDLYKLESDREKKRKRKEKKQRKLKKGSGVTAQSKIDQIRNKGITKKNLFVEEERSILDDIKKRRATRDNIMAKVGRKLSAAIQDKSMLIEAVNEGLQIPDNFRSSATRRKVSVAYATEAQHCRQVSRGRMRLPTIVRKKDLPKLPKNKKGAARKFYKRKLKQGAIGFGKKNENMSRRRDFMSIDNTPDSTLATQAQRSAALQAARMVGSQKNIDPMRESFDEESRLRSDTPLVATPFLRASVTERAEQPNMGSLPKNPTMQKRFSKEPNNSAAARAKTPTPVNTKGATLITDGARKDTARSAPSSPGDTGANVPYGLSNQNASAWMTQQRRGMGTPSAFKAGRGSATPTVAASGSALKLRNNPRKQATTPVPVSSSKKKSSVVNPNPYENRQPNSPPPARPPPLVNKSSSRVNCRDTVWTADPAAAALSPKYKAQESRQMTADEWTQMQQSRLSEPRSRSRATDSGTVTSLASASSRASSGSNVSRERFRDSEADSGWD